MIRYVVTMKLPYQWCFSWTFAPLLVDPPAESPAKIAPWPVMLMSVL
jgi:hypothetical protein